MQVAQVNSSVASALGQTPAEDSSSRADDFARVLKTAFYGKGSEAVAKTTERSMSDAAPRTETRTESRRDTRPAERVSYERAEPVETRGSDDAAPPRRDDAQRETVSADRPAEDRAPAKTPAQSSDKPAAKDTAKASESSQDAGKTDEAAAKDEVVASTDQAAAPATAAEDAATSEETPSDDAPKPAVATAPDAALILSLLQTQVVPTTTPPTTPSAEAVAEAPVVTVAAATPAVPAVNPLDTAATLAAAAATLEGEMAAPAAADAPVAKPATDTVVSAAAAVVAEAVADAAVPAVPQAAAAAMAKPATDTSAAALLSQQQTVTPEDFAIIQQAMTAQTQAQAGKPAVTAEAAPKTETRIDKSVTLDLQSPAAVAPKTLVDQASLFAMQGDEDAAADTALLQQQAQTAQQVQAQQTDIKFNTALLQAGAESTVTAATTASTTSPGQASQQHVAPMGGTTAPAVQTAQHAAATQTAARHLNAFIPAGEQVAVQIKKGVAEGVDKISIKLDPGNLGKVEIKLEIGHDGRLTAIVAADKPETLQLLQQDVKNLEQSLRDSGLKTDQQSLSFTLRDQGRDNDGRDGNGTGDGRQRNRAGEDYAETGLRTDPAQLAAANAQRAAAARGGLDIRI